MHFFLVHEDDSASLLLLLFAQQICSRDRGMASALTTGWHFCGIKGDPSASKELTLPALTFSKVEIKAPLQKIYGNWNGLQCVCQVSGALTCARAHTHQTWAAWPADDVQVLRSFHQAFQHLWVSHRTPEWGKCWISCFHHAGEQIKRRRWAQELRHLNLDWKRSGLWFNISDYFSPLLMDISAGAQKGQRGGAD